MEITTTQYNRCDLVKAVGRIDSKTAPELEQAFNAVIDAGKSGIVFDMQEVNFISSRGLRVLLETQKTFQQKNGKLVLANVANEMMEALDLAGVTHFIDIFEDTTSAVGSF